MCRKLCHFIWNIWWFHWSKDFEAMKAGKSAIQPWLSCPYNEHTLMDLPSSVYSTVIISSFVLFKLTNLAICFTHCQKVAIAILEPAQVCFMSHHKALLGTFLQELWLLQIELNAAKTFRFALEVVIGFLLLSTNWKLQCTLVIVNVWIVNNLSLVNIFGETGRFYYKINYIHAE